MKALQGQLGQLIGAKNVLIKFPDNVASQTNRRTKAI
jgi:hypothetical protein